MRNSQKTFLYFLHQNTRYGSSLECTCEGVPVNTHKILVGAKIFIKKP